MKTKRTQQSILVVTFVVLANAAMATQAQKQMPPKFSFMHEPEKVLSKYPLGLINEQEAFAHHGGPVRKMTLPNGNKGWLYSTGEEAGIPELYILQFSDGGKVIDVMHKNVHYKTGHSALQYQFLQKITPQLQISGPGPSE